MTSQGHWNGENSGFDFFLSYPHQEKKTAEEIKAALKQRRYSVYFDQERMRADAEPSTQLQNALKRSRWLLVLISNSTNDAFYQRKEFLYWEELRRNDRSRTAPIRLFTRPPNENTLNYVLAGTFYVVIDPKMGISAAVDIIINGISAGKDTSPEVPGWRRMTRVFAASMSHLWAGFAASMSRLWDLLLKVSLGTLLGGVMAILLVLAVIGFYRPRVSRVDAPEERPHIAQEDPGKAGQTPSASPEKKTGPVHRSPRSAQAAEPSQMQTPASSPARPTPVPLHRLQQLMLGTGRVQLLRASSDPPNPNGWSQVLDVSLPTGAYTIAYLSGDGKVGCRRQIQLLAKLVEQIDVSSICMSPDTVPFHL